MALKKFKQSMMKDVDYSGLSKLPAMIKRLRYNIKIIASYLQRVTNNEYLDEKIHYDEDLKVIKIEEDE